LKLKAQNVEFGMLNDELRIFFSGGLGAPRGRHRPTAQGRRDGGVASPWWRATAQAPRHADGGATSRG